MTQAIEYDRRRVGIGHYPWPLHDIDRKDMVRLADLEAPVKKKRLLYVHIPFCEHICPFCPYPKMINQEESRKKYLNALAKECELYGNSLGCENNLIEAVYFGGGTPSVLTTAEIEFLFQQLIKYFNFKEVKEITFEANPASLTREKIDRLKEWGTNRISLGVQTFNRETALKIGLIQTPADSFRAIKEVKEAKIPNLSIDLMYNLPGQTLEEWEADVSVVNRLDIDHVTLYPLKVIPILGLAKKIQQKKLPPCGDIHHEIAQFVNACQLLEEKGFKIETPYDLCKPGKSHHYGIKHFCRHMDLIALGNGSFGEINGLVYINIKDVKMYIETLGRGEFPVEKAHQVKSRDLPRKILTLGIRFLEVDLREFYRLFKTHPQELFPGIIEKLVDTGLVKISPEKMSLTRMDGIIWGNNVGFEFCDEAVRNSLPL